jgi:hypothetical protein
VTEPQHRIISANTATAAAEAIRRAHQTGLDTPGVPGHDDGDACEELAHRLTRDVILPDQIRYSATQDATPGADGIPRITIALRTEIGGEWVTPETVADAARALASTLSVRLGDVIAEIEGRRM